MNRQNTILFLLLYVPLVLFSQERARKWGDIPENDLKMTVYPQDSSASSVVLQDVGKIVLRANTGAVTLFRSRRIKVLDASAFDQGNLMITYRDTKREDELRDLDVQVTAPDGARKKIKSDNIFTEKLRPGRSARKIFIPDLQKGSVIEYRYQMQSNDILDLYDWYFQEDIPIRWSELETVIPEYYDYVILRNISGPFDLEETSQGSDGDGHNCYTNRWGLANIPALKDEPYTTSMDDYLTSIKFQLRTVIVPGKPPKTVISTWKELAKELEELEHFGVQYKKSGNFDHLWTAFSTTLAPDDTPEKKIEKALRFVGANMKWNGVFRYTTTDDLDDAFDSKTGTTADINLALVALLRKAGLNASPLLLSTRSNGQMYPQYPFLSQFNSVVVLVQIGEKASILDATDPFLPVNQLSTPFYHGAAWMVDKNSPDWVDIGAPESTQTWYGKMQLSETGEMAGSFNIQTSGNFASEWRSRLDTTQAAVFLRKNFGSSNLEMKMDSFAFSQMEALDQPLSVKFNCRISEAASVVNDFIYCQPVLDFMVLKSPFKSLTRSFPVEFETPFKAQYILDLVLPAGYTLEELPQPARVNLPENAGKLMFNCSKNANGGVQVILKMNIAKTRFSPEEYGALRQFFEIVVEKTQFQLVLKKA
jgi:hypothetical protein